MPDETRALTLPQARRWARARMADLVIDLELPDDAPEWVALVWADEGIRAAEKIMGRRAFAAATGDDL